MHWFFRKEGRDEQKGLSHSECWCVHFFFGMWKWPHTGIWTLTTSSSSNTDTTVKSVTYWELFLLYFHLDSPQFLVNFTSNASACLNSAKENKEKNCLLWAEEMRKKVFVILLPLPSTREGLGVMVVTESKQRNSRERWTPRDKCICTRQPQAHPRPYFLLQGKGT